MEPNVEATEAGADWRQPRRHLASGSVRSQPGRGRAGAAGPPAARRRRAIAIEHGQLSALRPETPAWPHRSRHRRPHHYHLPGQGGSDPLPSLAILQLRSSTSSKVSSIAHRRESAQASGG